MAGGVPTTGDFFAHVPHLQAKPAVDAVQDAGLSDGGIPGEGADLARQHGGELLHALACDGAGPHNRKARFLISVIQLTAGVQVALVQQNDGLNALVQGHHGHLVNKVGIGDRRRLGAQDHQLVDVGDGGTNESVAPGLPLQNIAP